MQRSLSVCQASYAIFPSDPQRKSIKNDCKCVSHIEIEIIFLKAACPKSPRPLPTSRICVFQYRKILHDIQSFSYRLWYANIYYRSTTIYVGYFKYFCLFVCLLFISMAVCKTSYTILNSICRRHADVWSHPVIIRYKRPPHHDHTSQYHGDEWMTHILFVPCQSTVPFLRKDYFRIGPWNSKVKVMGVVNGHGHIVSPVSD